MSKKRMENSSKSIQSENTTAGGDINVGNKWNEKNMLSNNTNTVNIQLLSGNTVLSIFFFLMLGLGGIVFYKPEIILWKQNANSEAKANSPKSEITTDEIKTKEAKNTPRKLPDPRTKEKTPVTKTKIERPSISSFLDISQNSDVAIIANHGLTLSNLEQIFFEQLDNRKIRYSNSILRKSFEDKFGSNVNGIDIAELKKMSIDQYINCICQIDENISYEEREVQGVKVVTIHPDIKIKVLDIKKGKKNTIPLNIPHRAGRSKIGALNTLKAYIWENKTDINFDLGFCK